MYIYIFFLFLFLGYKALNYEDKNTNNTMTCTESCFSFAMIYCFVQYTLVSLCPTFPTIRLQRRSSNTYGSKCVTTFILWWTFCCWTRSDSKHVNLKVIRYVFYAIFTDSCCALNYNVNR